MGRKVNVAVAANADAAIHAATFFKGVTFIAPGEENTGLGDIPIESLSYDLLGIDLQNPPKHLQPWDEILTTLKMWGITCFREFAELPTTGIAERFGQQGVRLQQLAAGRTERHLNLEQPAPVFESSLDLEYPIKELEPLSFVLARLLNKLCANLNAYSLATNELRLVFRLSDSSTHERKLRLPYPMRDHKVFLKLLLLDAEMHHPQAAIHALALTFDPVKPRVLQDGLFIPLAPAPEKLQLTLMRLAKLVGEGNVGSPELIDTHRPDAFRVKRFELLFRRKKKQSRQISAEIPQNRVTNITPNPQIALRVFRPPLRAMVNTERGFPTQINAWGPRRSVYGSVVGCAGPWRTTGDWWRDDRWARDEWDVAIADRRSQIADLRSSAQTLFRIYRELRGGAWFVEGAYD